MSISIETLAIAKKYADSLTYPKTFSGIKATVSDGTLVFEEDENSLTTIDINDDTLIIE